MKAPNSTCSIKPTYELSRQYYSLTITHHKKYTLMQMQLFMPFVRTDNLPHLTKVLKNKLPSILRSTCFNEKGQTFAKEVLNTELGHLFEHILLEYLCFAKLSAGWDEAVFSGNTKWNWRENAWGSFTINVSCGAENATFFQPSLEKTMELFDNLVSQPSLKINRPQVSTLQPIPKKPHLVH